MELSALEDNNGLGQGLASEGSVKLMNHTRQLMTCYGKYKSLIYLQLAVLLCGLWTNTFVSKNSFVDLKHKGQVDEVMSHKMWSSNLPDVVYFYTVSYYFH